MRAPSQWADAVRVVAIDVLLVRLRDAARSAACPQPCRAGRPGQPRVRADFARTGRRRGIRTSGIRAPLGSVVGVPIHLDVADRVATVTIDRTHRRNALNLEALEELHRAVASALADGARALVVTGAEGHFCAGADLTELEDVSFTSRLAEVLEHLAAAPVTTVAAIEGSCMGLGMQLAIACDVRVVGPTAALRRAGRQARPDGRPLDPRPGRPHLGRGRGPADGAHRRRARRRRRVAPRVRPATAATSPTRRPSPPGRPTSPRSARPARRSASTPTTTTTPRSPATRPRSRRAWASDDLAEGRRAFAERRDPGLPGALMTTAPHDHGHGHPHEHGHGHEPGPARRRERAPGPPQRRPGRRPGAGDRLPRGVCRPRPRRRRRPLRARRVRPLLAREPRGARPRACTASSSPAPATRSSASPPSAPRRTRMPVARPARSPCSACTPTPGARATARACSTRASTSCAEAGAESVTLWLLTDDEAHPRLPRPPPASPPTAPSATASSPPTGTRCARCASPPTSGRTRPGDRRTTRHRRGARTEPTAARRPPS